ncbi:AraC family transcriptional regulator [uncultured Tateyamaria sp.]|uniref:AraC family transcriptional regulator n=1 Tax=uncultured Tateyamaria sp. TaxID=455651 RepID=UPI00261045E4|nr:AraC family transcriptional regulator [uncultured Tateyamaria sp.]
MADDTQIRYKIARTTQQLCGLLQIAPAAVLRRMRYRPDFFENEGRGVTSAEYFAGWDAIVAEAGRADTPLFLGQAYARGPFNPAFFAFTCSPTVAIGLDRLALFKPLTGPLRLGLERTALRGLRVTKTSNVAAHPLPASFAATEIVFLTEAIRGCTGHRVTPLAAALPARLPCHAEIEDFVGCTIDIRTASCLEFAPEDADRVLLSADPDQWAQLEPNFRRQMQVQLSEQTVSARVRSVLPEMLPAGEASIEAAAKRLRLSARSLQRYLKDEGTRFQTLLDSTREDLARQYLCSTDLNIEEISYLLAYRDPNSFYRAFQNWTGMTPKAARMAAQDGTVAS